MILLLDTNIFIWWGGEAHLLSPVVRALLADDRNRLFLSMASIWEMQIKNQLGKLAFSLPLAGLIARQYEENGLEILPITLPHIYALTELPPLHRDPFDRLIIAQARVENMTILSVDEIMREYPVPVIG